MTGVDRGVTRPRWADLVDSDGEAAAGDVCVTVMLECGGRAYVVMESRDTIADLNVWIEKSQGLPRNSFALSHDGQYITRRRPMYTFPPACVLRLVSRIKDGQLRGMPLMRYNSHVKTKG